MNYRRFFLLTLVIALPFFALLPIYNWSVDYYRVFNEDYHHSYPGGAENKVYLKTKWLLDTQGSYDAIAFGSSRVMGGLSNKILGPGWVKFGIPGGLPKEQTHSLQVLLDHGIKPKKVILGIDDFDIYHARDNGSDYRYRLYPRDWLDRLDLLYFYTFAKFVGDSKRILTGKVQLQANTSITEDQVILLNSDAFAERNHEIKSLDAWEKDISTRYKPQINRAVSDIKAFVDLCAEHDIELDVFMTMRHYKLLYSRNYRDLANFRRALVKEVGYWDFTNLRAGYWKDNRYWQETSHFGEDTGKKILARMRGDNEYAAFGEQLSSDNIERFLASSYQTLLAELPTILADDNNTYVHDVYLDGPWQTLPPVLTPTASVVTPAVLRIRLEVGANDEKMFWYCDKVLISKLELRAGFNERYLPWDGSCRSGRAVLVSEKESAKIKILSLAISPIKALSAPI